MSKMKKKKKPTKYSLNTSDAAKYIGCSASLLRKLRSLGEGPEYATINTKVVYPKPSLKRYIQDNIVKTA